jgi:hypothetical protein
VTNVSIVSAVGGGSLAFGGPLPGDALVSFGGPGTFSVVGSVTCVTGQACDVGLSNPFVTFPGGFPPVLTIDELYTTSIAGFLVFSGLKVPSNPLAAPTVVEIQQPIAIDVGLPQTIDATAYI